MVPMYPNTHPPESNRMPPTPKTNQKINIKAKAKASASIAVPSNTRSSSKVRGNGSDDSMLPIKPPPMPVAVKSLSRPIKPASRYNPFIHDVGRLPQFQNINIATDADEAIRKQLDIQTMAFVDFELDIINNHTPTFTEVFDRLERNSHALSRTFGIISHLAGVCDEQLVRDIRKRYIGAQRYDVELHPIVQCIFENNYRMSYRTESS